MHAPTAVRPVAVVAAVALALSLLAAGAGAGARADEHDHDEEHPIADPAADWEIWALDQGEGLDRINVYRHDAELEEVATIDLSEAVDGGPFETPHMIDFDSRYRYAFVPGTRAGAMAVIRTADYEVVEVIPTGATAHMATVTPDDTAVWVANIGANTFTEILLDLDADTFTPGRELALDDDPLYQEVYGDWEVPPTPVCHEYTRDSRYAYLTLGPAAGGLVVVDLEALEIVEAFDPDVVRANCGLALSHDGQKMYANFGSAEEGEWYVFDTATHTLVGEPRSSRGIDAHGVRITPDGGELWQVNRVTSNAIVIDSATDEVVDEIDFVGQTPDILDFSPDGRYAYVSLRGPNPMSAPHVAVGDTPGFAVIDVAERSLLEVVEPAAGTDQHELSDFHGIGVRVMPTVTRLAGATRVETAVAISQDLFADHAADAAVLARADDYPDALAGVALAAAVGGPLLLTGSDGLAETVAAELLRLQPQTVTVLGGERALSAEVEAEVAELGFAVERVAGETRFETAVAIAETLGDRPLQLLTTGLDFPDALTAGAAAAAHDGVVLLTAGDQAHPATEGFLDGNPSEQRHAVGGPAAQAHPDVAALQGPTRHETAAAVAGAFFPEPRLVALAHGDDFPDALAGGVQAAGAGGPLLLTPGDELHDSVVAYVCGHLDTLERGYAYGGERVLGVGVLHSLWSLLFDDGCS